MVSSVTIGLGFNEKGPIPGATVLDGFFRFFINSEDVVPIHDQATEYTFVELDLLAAVDHVFAAPDDRERTSV